MMSTKNLAVAMAATLVASTNAQDGNAPDCSAEQNACMAAADCLAIMMSSMGSCGDPPCQANYGADGQADGTCSGGDSCTFVAGSTPDELMAALMANTEGAAYMACQMGGAADAQDETPCDNDADRVETTVFAACMGDETCLGILMSDAMQTDEGANPSQAQVYDSGCGDNDLCCDVVTCKTTHRCVPEPTPATAPTAASSAMYAAPGVLLAFAALFAN